MYIYIYIYYICFIYIYIFVHMSGWLHLKKKLAVLGTKQRTSVRYYLPQWIYGLSSEVVQEKYINNVIYVYNIDIYIYI